MMGQVVGAANTRERWGRDERGVEFARIVAFSDGVLAIAITLLVLNLEIPESLPAGQSVIEELLDERGDLIAYAISFAVIGRLWIVHHRFFADLTHFDGVLMTLNLVYLGFVVLIPFSSELLGDHGGDPASVIIYAVNLAITQALGVAMFSYAARNGLTGEKFREYMHRPLRTRGLIGALLFAVSIPIALFSTTAAVLIWVAVFFVPGLRGRRA